MQGNFLISRQGAKTPRLLFKYSWRLCALAREIQNRGFHEDSSCQARQAGFLAGLFSVDVPLRRADRPSRRDSDNARAAAWRRDVGRAWLDELFDMFSLETRRLAGEFRL